MRSSSTRPGPTGASWSTSPTSSTCVRGPTAPKSASARRTDSIEASSTMSTSVPGIGSSGPRAKPSSGAYSSSRWIVVAGAPVISASRRAALPVGAHRRTVRRSRVQEVDERAHRHRLAGARAAGEDRQPAVEDRAHHRPLGVGGGEVARSGARWRPGAGAARRRSARGRGAPAASRRRACAGSKTRSPSITSRPRAASSSMRSSASAPSMRRARSASSARGRWQWPSLSASCSAWRSPASRRPGESGGVPSAWASASAVAKPMPSSSVSP